MHELKMEKKNYERDRYRCLEYGFRSHLKHDMTQVLLISIERLQQLQRFAVQQKYLIAFRKNQFECDFGERIAEYRQFIRCRSLIDNCEWIYWALQLAHSVAIRTNNSKK